jgi:hypothetical protein
MPMRRINRSGGTADPAAHAIWGIKSSVILILLGHTATISPQISALSSSVPVPPVPRTRSQVRHRSSGVGKPTLEWHHRLSGRSPATEPLVRTRGPGVILPRTEKQRAKSTPWPGFGGRIRAIWQRINAFVRCDPIPVVRYDPVSPKTARSVQDCLDRGKQGKNRAYDKVFGG